MGCKGASMALPGDRLANGHHLWEGKLCHPGWGEPACLNSISAPALPTSGTKASQSACTMPHTHTGTRLLRLFCKHWLKQREQRFFAPVWFTQHCLWPMFPKQGKYTGPVLTLLQGTLPQAGKSPQHLWSQPWLCWTKDLTTNPSQNHLWPGPRHSHSSLKKAL